MPKSQLVSQWKELNSIFKKQDKHLLINYVYKYDKCELQSYTYLLFKEFKNRNYKIRDYKKFDKYFVDVENYYVTLTPFKNDHTRDYLLKCFMNLEEKYFCGQKDFNRSTYLKLWNFVNDELNGLLQEISKELKEE